MPTEINNVPEKNNMKVHTHRSAKTRQLLEHKKTRQITFLAVIGTLLTPVNVLPVVAEERPGILEEVVVTARRTGHRCPYRHVSP